MCNFVVVATTKLHSNSNINYNNREKTINLHKCPAQFEITNKGNVCRLIFLFLLLFCMCNFVVVATTKLQSNNYNNRNKTINLHKCPAQFEITNIGNVCRLIFLFLLLFFMCNFVVVATTKLHSNNNSNKKINLHRCPGQFERTHIY